MVERKQMRSGARAMFLAGAAIASFGASIAATPAWAQA